MSGERPYNVLFLCTGNSARSILAEAILNKAGAERFRAYSAGSHPKGRVHSETLRLLRSLGYDTSAFSSKSWDEFAEPGALALRFVFTGPAAMMPRPKLARCGPVQPTTAPHWGVPDPAAAGGTAAEISLAFKDAYRMLNQRISIFMSLPLCSLDKLTLQNKLKDIGRS